MTKAAFEKIRDGLQDVRDGNVRSYNIAAIKTGTSIVMLTQEELDMVLRPMLQLKGYRLTSSGKIEKIKGYGLSASGKIKQRTSKKVRVVKKGKA